MKNYNINELLERKKEIENQMGEQINAVNANDLTYVKEEIVDYSNSKNNRETIPKAKITLADYTQKYNGLAVELNKIKIGISKFNSTVLAGLLENREQVRSELSFLKRIRASLPTEKKSGQRTTRVDKEGGALEIIRGTTEPMFERKEVDKQMDQLAAEERKINTKIQKLNLSADIELAD